MKLISNLAWVIAVLGSVASVSAAPVVITNKNLAAEKISTRNVKAVLLGNQVAWDTAGRVILVALKGGPVAEEFLQAHAGMSASAFVTQWRRRAMTGTGTAPKFFEKEEEVRKFVAETPGAIGFLDAANADASVLILSPQ